jgi:L-lysine exporter family protein LysE/ArgO
MAISTSLIGNGIVLGLGAAVPVGPINVEIARRTLRRGFAAGFALGCGAVSVDVTYAILTSLSIGQFLNRPSVLWPVAILGTAFLLYLAFLSFRGAWKDWKADPLTGLPPPSQSHRGGYLTGVTMTLLNPMTIGFWFIAIPSRVAILAANPRRDLPTLCLGVFVGTLGWVICFAGLLAWAGRWRRKWWLPLADSIGGVALLALAAAGLWRACRSLL